MRVNVEKVLERDQKLTELDQRADALQHGASQFEQQAGKLKRKQWWANMKMMIIMGVIGIVLLLIIIGKCVCIDDGIGATSMCPMYCDGGFSQECLLLLLVYELFCLA